jgi:7,8-dihydropterin-6-yl-methyl-4-(beta-D-ribofuranosyl)aminobenzene 5'-phosphate synthase
MMIRVIATGSSREDRAAGNWGLSLLVGDDLLFDSYGVPAIFKRRLQEEGIDVSEIRDVVISHEHWDHTSGLWDLMLRNRGCRGHVCPHASSALVENIELFGGVVSASGEFRPIRDGIVTTGEMAAAFNGNALYEQALVLASAMGPVVITGCAHPGIIPILEKVRQ